MNRRSISLFFAAALAALPIQAQSSGDAPSVQSLAGDVAALAARVAKLEGQIVAADLVGVYALRGFQIELSGGPGKTASVASYTFTGTVTLNADGTASFAASAENGNTLALTTPPSVSVFKGSGGGSGTGTWTYADGVVTFSGIPPLSVAAGGRILVASSANHDDGTDVILFLTRLQ
jgi:hypothetical protein